ncbi:MAG: S49 family peptidase, partial [Pseudomonadota bacterium]
PIWRALTAVWRALPFTPGDKPVVTVLTLSGAIGDTPAPGSKGLNAARLEDAIKQAFKPQSLKAVALAINSPGGSPVQSRLIHNAIRREAAKKGVPVLAFIEDVGASGGYILAAAGDEIFADESSIVGSIGVVSAGFGFTEAIARLGVDRRVHTAGDNKSQLDPFRPERPEEVARLETILNTLHEQFIGLVKNRRGEKLSASHDDTFSGAFWAAPEAKARGLVDEIAQMGDFLPRRFGDDVIIKRITPGSSSLLKRLLSGRGDVPGPLVDPAAVISALDERALWARYGR